MKMKKKAIIAAVAFAAAMNLSACTYGPPYWDEEEYEDTTQTEEETSYAPADNINEDVYGPPIDE